MKSITFASGTIVTGSAVAKALVDYVASLSGSVTSSSIEIPVQEANGTIAMHTIVLGSAVQFDIADIDGVVSEEDEESQFPVPSMPEEKMVAVIPDATEDLDSENFNKAVDDIENMLDDPSL
jgi:hypothetical protein